MKKPYIFLILTVLALSCLCLTGCGKKEYSVIDTIEFGTYQQSNNIGEVSAIKWDVLEKKGNKALIISHYILDVVQYDDGYSNNYEESYIRAWLNNDFYNTAFTEEEKAKILTTKVNNSASTTGYSNGNPYACKNTSDKIFLLSFKEAEYLSKQKNTGYDASDDLKAECTQYADSKYIYKSENSNTSLFACWWLRSPSKIDNEMAWYVTERGTVNICAHVYNTHIGVRPVCWIVID